MKKVKFGFLLVYNLWDSFCKQLIILILIMSILQLKVVQRETDPTCYVPSWNTRDGQLIDTKSTLKPYRRNVCRQRYLPYTSKTILLKLCSLQNSVAKKTCSNVSALCDYKYINTLNRNESVFSDIKRVGIKGGISSGSSGGIGERRKWIFSRLRKTYKNNTIHWKNKSLNIKQNSLDYLSGVWISTYLCVKERQTGFNGGSFFGIQVASANNLPFFTTEKGIFTGLPPVTTPTPKPIPDFDVNVEEAFASFTFLKITWKSIYDVSKIRIQHTDKDSSFHTIEIKVNLTGDFTPNVVKEDELRRGFIYKLGSLYGNRRYYLQVWATADNVGGDLYTVLSFLSGDQDVDDRAYNLNGIFLVLGISTIIMVVVMVCVGYEKILLQKRDSCKDFLCCRGSKQPKVRPPNGSISPEPMKVPRRGQIFPLDENTTNSTTEIVRY